MSDGAPAREAVDFQTSPERYRHWRLSFDGPVATLTMQVDPEGGLRDDYELKLNSYDLAVDIELADAVQRLRFEHPEVHAVVLTGGVDKVFCAGANIQMLAGSSHHHKVNFCKFTNETRNGIEDATAHSGQVWIAAVNGTAAGGGYELALACDEILLIDDLASAVSLPEVPLLAVLPGTGGLTRVVDKRHVRRDLADVFATRTEGSKGRQAVEWGLVDELAPRSPLRRGGAGAGHRPRRALATVPTAAPASASTRSSGAGTATTGRPSTSRWPSTASSVRPPSPSTDRPVRRRPDGDALVAAGAASWLLAAGRELDEAILDLRFNEPEVGTWVLKTQGDPGAVLAADDLLRTEAGHWLVREVRLYWARTLKRLDVSARTLVALIDPGSCFAGTLAELALAADRSFMLDGTVDNDEGGEEAALHLTDANDGWYPMVNGLSRLAARFWGHDDELDAARARFGKELLAEDAAEAGLVTSTPDDLDWDDEIRLALEERNSFSPDALTGLEANLRFVGPETMESKIFARLTAWQNWIFQRPNAVGDEGALRRFGTGARPTYDRRRV